MNHINVSEPNCGFDAQRLDRAKRESESKFYEQLAEHYREELDNIFARIGDGETVELHYSDGKIIIVGEKGERRKR